METRCPEGAGQGQRRWPGAQHDSPGSRQGSRPASAKSVREYQQQNEKEQAAYYHRQEKNLTHWPEKTSPGMRKIRPATG
ncbi:hypothetical protein DSM88_21710 [Salmonella enterica subsp. enterica]|nr:hypothetical protein [Salmonella enterica subsp. enterica serovar Manhattan]EBS4566227.1 hypothetical protein [Salmonella enterica subsp. enterica serovar Tanger]ECC9278138.1 hypothetical protein [Salmonella enterica subsp. enterica]EBU8489784.1 hypothetical protein [Salmonella enterica subsp. enterica serovar Manhattan]EBU8723367.1 hypothetical protein [Salmonella enterica subsp. enterica serovar Manhattan]